MTIEQFTAAQDTRKDSEALRMVASELLATMGYRIAGKVKLDMEVFQQNLARLDRCLEYASLGNDIGHDTARSIVRNFPVSRMQSKLLQIANRTAAETQKDSKYYHG